MKKCFWISVVVVAGVVVILFKRPQRIHTAPIVSNTIVSASDLQNTMPQNVEPHEPKQSVSFASDESSKSPVEATRLTSQLDSKISAAIQHLLDDKAHYPHLKTVKALTTNDEALLIQLYDKETELTNKSVLTWALAAVGGDASAIKLQRTLIADYGQRSISGREREILRDTMEALGLIASRSEQAFLFLMGATSEDYWQKYRTWRQSNPRAEADANRAFTGLAIQALGASGKQDFMTRVSEIKERSPDTARGIVGSIVDGMFYYDVGKEEGIPTLLEHHLTAQSFNKFQKWIETENGRKWHEWSLSMRKTKSSQTEPK